MLAGMRSCFLLSFCLAFYGAAGSPAHAQVNGVAPLVTSMAFGGSNVPRGIKPSVTSLGPNGSANSVFGASNFFLPANPPRSFEHQHRRKDKDREHDKNRADFPVGVLEPVYVPFAVPYAQETDDDDSPDDYVHAPSAWDVDAASRYSMDRDSAMSEDPVIPQPSTVLVFRDGHQSDVLNYAIVGDTLFDFADGRTKKILLADLDLPATRKANYDKGVDFQIPVSSARQ
jgi:hypothetical protein